MRTTQIAKDFSGINDYSTLVDFVGRYELETKEHADTFIVATHEGVVDGNHQSLC